MIENHTAFQTLGGHNRPKTWSLLLLLASISSWSFAGSQTGLDELQFSADIDNSLPAAVGEVHSDDGAIIIFDLAAGTAISNNDLGNLHPAGIDGFHRDGDGCGDTLYSLDTTTVISGTAMRPADVFTAAGVKIFDAAAAGIPAGVNIDAVSRDPSTCFLLLSIDSSAQLGTATYTPDDIIQWSSGSGFSLHQSTGFRVNIDALHYLAPGRFLVSLDVGGALPDIDSLDDEVVEINTNGGGGQVVAFEPSNFNDSWQGADLNSLWALPTPLVGSVQWQLSAVSILENAVTLSLDIDRVGGSAGNISLNWSTSSGSATAGIDFISGGGNVAMSDGQVTAQVTITLIDDALIEGTESFTASIDSATNGASVGNPSQIQISILDNEDYIFADSYE